MISPDEILIGIEGDLNAWRRLLEILLVRGGCQLVVESVKPFVQFLGQEIRLWRKVIDPRSGGGEHPVMIGGCLIANIYKN